MLRYLMRGFVLATALLAVAMFGAAPSATAAEPGQVLIGIYHVAPGKHADFLKWQAARDAIDKEAGVPQAQWYAHTEGDSWDFLSIGPDLSPAQQKKVDDASKAKGVTTGIKASLEFRQYITSHTDTFANGPMTVTEMSAMASGQ